MAKCPFTFLWKNKKLEENGLLRNSNHVHIKLSVQPGVDLETQLKLINLTKEDLAVAKTLLSLFKDKIGDITTGLYNAVVQASNLVEIVKAHSTIETWAETFQAHLIDMFGGIIDQEYVQKRVRIGHTHVRVGLDQKWYKCAMQVLLTELIKVLDEAYANPQEKMTAILVVTKILSIEQQIVEEAYNAMTDEIRNVEANLKNDVKIRVNATSTELAALVEETKASIEEMTFRTEDIANQSKQGTEFANNSEELALKGKEQLETLQSIIEQVQDSTKTISKDVKELTANANQISKIIELVQSIADQTNLLALNAAIEAARAGNHGRGFAVVADEVRKLAEQTKQSVFGITELIEKTNSRIHHSVNSINQVESLVAESTMNMHVTDRLFEEILIAMKEMKKQNTKIESELDSFRGSIQEIAGASLTIAASTDELIQSAEKL